MGYTTASESERQNINEAVISNYEEKTSSFQQQASQEIIAQPSIINDKKMPIEQPHDQEQFSSTSSASTIVAGNEPNVTTISTNLSDIKNSNTGATTSSNPLE